MPLLGSKKHLDVQTRIVELLDETDILTISLVNAQLYHVVRDSVDTQTRLYLRLQAMDPGRIAKFDNCRDLIAAQEARLRFVPKSARSVDFAPATYDVIVQGGVVGLGDARENFIRIADGKKASLPVLDHPHYGVDGDVRITMTNTSTFSIYRIVCEQIPFQDEASARASKLGNHLPPSAAHPVLTLVNAPFGSWGPIVFAAGGLALISVRYDVRGQYEEAVMVLDWQAGDMVAFISARSSTLSVTPLDDDGVLVVSENRRIVYVPLNHGQRAERRLSGPTFDWEAMWPRLTDDEHAVRLVRLEEAPLGPIRLHVEAELHVVCQNVGTNLSPPSIDAALEEQSTVQEWKTTKQKLWHVGGLTLKRRSDHEDSVVQPFAPFEASRPDAASTKSITRRSYLTGVLDSPPSVQYPFVPTDSSCWLAGRLICLHQYRPGGIVVLRVVDMSPRRSRFAGNAGLGALKTTFGARLRETISSHASLQAESRDCPADFVWDEHGSPWHGALWSIQLPDPPEGKNVRVVKLAVDGDHLIVVCKTGGEDWPYLEDEDAKALHRIWCIEFP